MTAVVIGGGLAGLVTARELLRRGEPVTLYEAANRLGGLVRPTRMGNTVLDGGAEAFALRTSVVGDLCAELGLDVSEPAGQPHIWWPEAPHRWPMANGVLGIPGSLDDPSLAALTPAERVIAARDLHMGGDVAADETRLGPLVEARLGPAVVERLVEPVTRCVHGLAARDMDVDLMAPGLRGAMRQHGSLMAAVAAVRTPGAAVVAQPVGGLHRLVEALATDIERLGGRIHTGHALLNWQACEDGWRIHTRAGVLHADRVVLAVGGGAAAEMLALLGEVVDVPPTHPSFQAVVALTHPGLAAGPVGSGIIVGRPDERLRARALTHYSLKWPWAAREGQHLVRIAYGEAPSRQQVVADASLLMGVELTEDDVSGFEVLRWEMPRAITAEARAALGRQLSVYEGLTVTGAWVAGNGIAAVVAAAVAEVAA